MGLKFGDSFWECQQASLTSAASSVGGRVERDRVEAIRFEVNGNGSHLSASSAPAVNE